VLARIYRHYQKAFGCAYAAAREERQWVDMVTSHTITDSRRVDGKWGHFSHHEYDGQTAKCRRAKYVLCLVGGGARVQPILTSLSQPLSSLRFDDVRVETPSLPDNLRLLQPGRRVTTISADCRGELPLLLLAYGLAHRAIDIPEWSNGSGIQREVRFRPQVSHEELYGA
jgi:hypothetical protein